MSLYILASDKSTTVLSLSHGERGGFKADDGEKRVRTRILSPCFLLLYVAK